MAVNTGPVGSTGPISDAPLSLRSILNRFRAIETAIYRMQQNRTPQPTAMSAIADASSMSQASDGHTPTFDQASGEFQPAPVFAELTFHLAGDLVTGISPPNHTRYRCAITGVSADMGNFISDVVFDVTVNGSTVATVTMTSNATGLIPVTPFPVVPYTDLVRVDLISAGTGNIDLVVHVGMGVVPGVPIG